MPSVIFIRLDRSMSDITAQYKIKTVTCTFPFISNVFINIIIYIIFIWKFDFGGAL